MSREKQPRRICFVTGTRAEFGLMRSTLHAIAKRPRLKLQIVATGMHLDPACGRSIRQIKTEGWAIDGVVPWKPARDATGTAAAMGKATAAFAQVFEKLSSDIVLVVGDRVEAFAAVGAAHVGRRIVAHVHGGDRALGQVDDALRHAITKLAHLHFPATTASAARLARLGEDEWRIHPVGSPGVDGLLELAASAAEIGRWVSGLVCREYALLLLHPTTPDENREARLARLLYNAVRAAGIRRLVIVGPNNDPGSRAIAAVWESLASTEGIYFIPDLPRPVFLGLMRDAAMLVGNSSSGIIEAASFGTPVLDVGDRQRGRDRGENVSTVSFESRAIRIDAAAIYNGGRSIRFPAKNLYGGGNTGVRIASILDRASLNDRLLRKLITY